jgi:hypothetical protein
MSDELEALKKIDLTLNDLLKWTKFAGMQQLRNILAQQLKTDSEMLVYELSDGSRGTRDIAKLAGVGSNATVAAYWKKWSKLGIMEASKQYQGRYQRICSLEEVGLTVPQAKTTTTQPPAETQSEEQGEIVNE